MASLAENTARVIAAFDNIKTAISESGVTVEDGTPVAEYPDKINDVYDNGYEDGYDDGINEGGGDSWYDEFWDNFQDYGNKIDYQYAFRGEEWNDITFNPKHRANVKYGPYIFYQSKVPKSENKVDYFDFSACANVAYAFSASAFTRLPTLNFSSVTSATNIFQHCGTLKTIDKIIISEDGSFPFTSATFSGCNQLTEIRFEGVIGKDFYIQYSKLLSKDSIINIFGVLSSTTEGLSASFSKGAVNSAFETGKGLADGTSSTEWAELIATKPNWTITLV